MMWSGMKSFHVGIFCTVFFLFSTVTPLSAEIYRYIDRNGVRHFTNTPTSSKFKRYIWGKPKQYLWRKAQRFYRSYSADQYNQIISRASLKHGIDFPLLKAIIKVESNFNPKAVSKAGARGLMQIMPNNFTSLRINNPFDPTQNIMGGASYFRQLLDRFEGNIHFALAAYNAGPKRVDRFNSVPPIRETQEYVRKVMKYYYYFKER